MLCTPSLRKDFVVVAFLDIERDARAVVFRLARAHGDNLALLRLFLGRVGDDDAADFLLAFIDALHDDAVVKRPNLYCDLRCGHVCTPSRACV
jgi:hypothetical protein